jgi:hypothetical protein
VRVSCDRAWPGPRFVLFSFILFAAWHCLTKMGVGIWEEVTTRYTVPKINVMVAAGKRRVPPVRSSAQVESP